MIAEYKIAVALDRVWQGLILRRGCPAADGRRMAYMVSCDSLLSASNLLRAQEFTIRIWSRLAVVMIILNFPVLGVMAAVNPAPFGRGVFADIMGLFVCLAVVAIFQALMLRFRAMRTQSFILSHPFEAGEVRLPSNSRGIPRKGDFWLVSVAAIVIFCIFSYASLTL